MFQAFELGGWGMIPTFLFGTLMVASAVKYALNPERRFVPLLVSLGLMTLVMGTLGLVTGMIRCFLAMEHMPPDDRWIWMLGLGEALNNIGLALGLVGLGLVATTVGAFRVSRVAAATG
jgi:hypothetical protein